MTPQPEPIETIELYDGTIIPFERGGSYSTSIDDIPNRLFVNGNGLFELDPNLFKGNEFQARTPYTDTRMGYYTSGAGIYQLHAGGLDGEVIFTFYFGDE